jgi:hypothetical protein
MKRIALLLCLALACVGIGRAAYQAAAPCDVALSKFVPAGPLLYLEAKDFSSLLGDWNSSPQKKEWIRSDNYEIFSRSRLFLRLKGAGDQFAAAAGLPPDMNFLSQVAGKRSALALYDIGKLQFLYVTYLPSARSMQTTLWQARAKFEPRNAGGVDFYLRRDPESQREVAFAVAGDYLLLATREDLMAAALQLISGKPDRTVEDEAWWAQSTAAAGPAGDLRMVLDMQTLVPNGYFRTYWAQQNITDLSQYSAAVSDLFRSAKEYREERVLIRKLEPARNSSPESLSAVAGLSNLVPDDAGIYRISVDPTPDASFALLETKLLAPRLGPAPASQLAPQVQLTSGEQSSTFALETRIDQAPPEPSSALQTGSELKALLQKSPILASLQLQSTQLDSSEVFVRMNSAVVLAAASDWNLSEVQSAITDLIRPALTASELGVSWQAKSGFDQLDGLWPLAVFVRGKYLVVCDDPALMETVLSNFNRKSAHPTADFIAGFNHRHERANFAQLVNLIDRPNASNSGVGVVRQPQFFSGNIASLSNTLSDVSSERIEIHSEGRKVRQTVIYEWAQ